jgi:hypothetical protein
MKNFNVKIKFIAPYLQARFSEIAKEQLMEDAKKTVIKNVTEEDLGWIQLSYVDDTGYFIPAEQIESSLVASAKDFKMKSKRSSLKEYAKATIFVTTLKNYLNKTEPDEKMVSYPKRRDGNRVKIIHPAFHPGSEISFEIQCLDDDFSDKTIKEMVENAGRKYGLGARRPKFGRFELVGFKKL